MSKPLDYSKWDKLDLSDDDEDSVYHSMPSAVSNQFPSISSVENAGHSQKVTNDFTMSKPLDYSKWDKLELSDNDEDSVYRSMPSAVSNQFPSISSIENAGHRQEVTNDAQHGGCNHVITPAGTTTKDLNVVQSVF
jgi:hypothetical protein